MVIASPFPIEYAEDLWSWLNTPREMNFEDGGPEDFESFLVQLKERLHNEKTFAMYDAITFKPIGFIGLVKAGSIGMMRGMVIDPARRGQGLGAAFLRLVVKTMRAQGWNKFTAFFFADNTAVLRTFKRAGAVEEGYLKATATRGGKAIDVRLWSFNPQEGA